MNTTATVFEIINEKFPNIQDLGDGCFRGQRLYKGKAFATVYFDISDNIVKRANNLLNFQEKLLGADFFKADMDHRWNNYLYFLAGPKSQQQDEFDRAKSDIETDRHFARKFVLTKDELLDRFGDIPGQKLITHVNKDASARWEDLLFNASLGEVLEQNTRKSTVERIGSGEAFIANRTSVTQPLITRSNNQLGTGILRSLRVKKFRSAIDGQEFSFGNVNLIFGQNGAGKTSLLESIEALYCGHIRSDNPADPIEIDGELEMPDGSLFKIESTKTASVIKARNLAWYGRSNPRSEAITSSFTQFNFLDTDAAFRLANVTKANEIIEDLSPLLVGAGASKLWNYITKLKEDVNSKLKEASKEASSLIKQFESLDREVKRLKESPSESTALANTYRASLKAIGAKWELGESNTAILSEGRSDLEFLLRGFNDAIKASKDTPTTIELLQSRKKHINNILDMLLNSIKEREAIQEDIFATNILIKKYKSDLQSLQDWALYCNADAPMLYENRTQKLMAVKKLHNTTEGVLSDEIIKISAEYESLSIHEAIRVTTSNLELAMRQELSAIENVEQLEKLGRSLSSLRSELRTIATSIMEHTEDFSHCPVCMTSHKGNELLRRIESINSSEASIEIEGFRQAVQVTKRKSQIEKKTLQSLESLKHFATTNKLPNTTLVGKLREQLMAERQELFNVKNELLALNLAYDSLSELGIDWNRYSEVRDAASTVLGAEYDVSSQKSVNKAKKLLSIDMDAVIETVSQLHNKIITIDKECMDISISLDIPNTSSMTLKELVLEVERARFILQESINFLNKAEQYLELQSNQHLESIQLSLQQIMVDFDRAKKAEYNEVMAKTELSEKTKELQEATLTMEDVLLCCNNFDRANNVLNSIISDYSLEEATRDAFESIRIYVTDIFLRIHSPAEYKLGNFYDGLSLENREGKEHSVNQVSTGQRAALALSIFLALNLSAENAPPIMLIDDPIAHIDDLNTLSFIDYLRDLAIDTNKQIFFATADDKLAALFQKKFEFLGERYKKIILPR